MLSAWIRVIRIKFLLSSVIAVFVGLAINWWAFGEIDFLHAFLTMLGVLSLHVSVDLLNDYWDFKRGIDTLTKRTKMSGGTGVLPDGLLKPNQVYSVGLIFLILGSVIGSYFVIIGGPVIGILLTFAIVSIYFYSTKIVDSGLAEIFVAIKGTMIVLGTYYIQAAGISHTSILSGIFIGILSSIVLFITSFPDYEADKSKGRKTLVIVVGKEKATFLFLIFPITAYTLLLYGIVSEMIPMFCIISFFTIPLFIKAVRILKKNFDNTERMIPAMTSTILFSRLTGILFLIGFLLKF